MNRTLLAALQIALIHTLALGQPIAQAPTAPGVRITEPSKVRSTNEWDLGKKNLAIEGYDPVAYFPEGGGKATKGDKKITLEHEGALYRFASTENRDRFAANPAKYEPAYGGWCAWAMLDGDKTEIDPKTFIVKDGRLFLFYNGFFGNTKKDWLKGDHDEQAARSDTEWKKLSGESPRVAPKPGTEP